MKEVKLEAKRIADNINWETLYYNQEEIDRLNREEAVNEGIEKGKSQRNIEIAKSLLELNVSLDIIIKSTGLTEEELKMIINDK